MTKRSLILVGIQKKKILNGQKNGLLRLMSKDGKTHSLQRKWDFGSMIDAFKDGEYELLSCEIISENRAIFRFMPWADPYGGTGCMQALVESFGFKVTKIED